VELEDDKRLAEVGDIKALDYVRFERGLTARIDDPEAGAKRAGMRQ
jgi:hypothetical protein